MVYLHRLHHSSHHPTPPLAGFFVGEQATSCAVEQVVKENWHSASPLATVGACEEWIRPKAWKQGHTLGTNPDQPCLWRGLFFGSISDQFALKQNSPVGEQQAMALHLLIKGNHNALGPAIGPVMELDLRRDG